MELVTELQARSLETRPASWSMPQRFRCRIDQARGDVLAQYGSFGTPSLGFSVGIGDRIRMVHRCKRLEVRVFSIRRSLIRFTRSKYENTFNRSTLFRTTTTCCTSTSPGAQLFQIQTPWIPLVQIKGRRRKHLILRPLQHTFSPKPPDHQPVRSSGSRRYYPTSRSLQIRKPSFHSPAVDELGNPG